MRHWKSARPTTRRQVALFFVGIVLATGICMSLAGCGGDDEKDPASTSATATTAPAAEKTLQPTTTPQAERPWAFLGTRRIMTTLVPANLGLYRSLLPEQFDMPDQPLVVVAVIHYYDVSLPLVPYREGYVSLQCKYQGRTGWYTYTMPVDDKTANDGGRAIGFNKYVADEITLEEQDGIWTGRVVHGGRAVMEIVFTTTSEPVTVTGGGEAFSAFNLVPPGEGPKVNEVRSSASGEQTTVTTSGSATVKADPGEPWAGLLNPDGSTLSAVLQEITGDSVLEWTEQE